MRASQLRSHLRKKNIFTLGTEKKSRIASDMLDFRDSSNITVPFSPLLSSLPYCLSLCGNEDGPQQLQVNVLEDQVQWKRRFFSYRVREIHNIMLTCDINCKVSGFLRSLSFFIIHQNGSQNSLKAVILAVIVFYSERIHIKMSQ